MLISGYLSVAAQSSTNSPYTRYGLGDLSDRGFANNAAMGGIGYGIRNNGYINMTNPAAFSSVDSLSFMFDLGMSLKSSNFKENGISANAKNSSFDYIAIHDGARPFATKELIIRTLATAAVVGGAAPATRVTDALRTLSPDGMISSTVDKSSIIALQTPQIFSADKLFDAYDAFHDSADDDVEIFIKAGYKAAAIQGDRKNRKITYADDIPDAAKQIEEYAAAREKGRKSAAASRRMRELMAEGNGK